jgi:signal transduction histidine kinase
LFWEAPQVPVTVTGDPAQLSHLFSNVIGNAVEAAGPGGSASVSLELTATGIIVEVADTGPGPPEGIAAKLFEPFVTGKEEGIGLGLAVARQAAAAHGGTVTWQREGGKTLFRITLTLWAGKPPSSFGHSRRNFLSAGTLALGNLTLADILQQEARAEAGGS